MSDASPSSGIAAAYYAIVEHDELSPLTTNCDTGIAFTDNQQLNIPTGDKKLYLCAKDVAGNISIWEGSYRWQNEVLPPTPPVIDNNNHKTEESNHNNDQQQTDDGQCAAPTVGLKAPHITYAARLSPTRINLFFEVGEKPFTHYLLFYGYQGKEKTFGAMIKNPDDGVFPVGDLLPGYNYDFEIVPYNDCSAGSKSNNFPVGSEKNSQKKLPSNSLTEDKANISEKDQGQIKADSENTNLSTSENQEKIEINKVISPTPTPTPTAIPPDSTQKKNFLIKFIENVKSWFGGK